MSCALKIEAATNTERGIEQAGRVPSCVCGWVCMWREGQRGREREEELASNKEMGSRLIHIGFPFFTFATLRM